MALPLVYSIESLRARWRSSLVAVAGIAGSVAVFVAMLALARGFELALVSSGSPDNALVRRAGATSEMDSVIDVEELRVLQDAPEVARDARGPLVSGEIVVLVALPLRQAGTEANVMVRGVTARALDVHGGVRVAEGRMLTPGTAEVVVGRYARNSYAGLDLGASVRLGGTPFTIVGFLDAGGSAFDSEIWADEAVVGPAYQRPRGYYQSAAARLVARDALGALRERVASDPRMRHQVDRETEYYAKASQAMRGMILSLGALVAAVMGVGAVCGALNTLYSAVAERARELATIRALGFGGGAVVIAIVAESLLLAAAGGVLGALLAWPLDGLTTSTLNFQTFSHVAFAFRVTPDLLALGFGFALAMGAVGGLPPALRAVRVPVAVALRDL
ncbi:MAG: ABC transporter permease [Vicinamibacteria bacterium]|nr:ABC transporter permease [Vicinamibacteria bacterium]